jgi:uncharacterized membrane protein (DUF4010 family)
VTYWQPYLIAIVIGLLVGIERERTHSHQKELGVRTFLLISLLGAVAGGLQITWISVLVTAFALGLILIAYFTKTHGGIATPDRGLTTEFAAGVVFVLGVAAHEAPALSAIIGPVVALILFAKKSLHRFSHAITRSELEAALLLLLAAVVIINLVPDTVIDPLGVFNPRKFGYLVLTLALLEFSSYVLTKVIDEKKGSLIIGFLGGLVSSTAVFFSSAKRASQVPSSWRFALCTTIAAKLASLIELLLIIGLISGPLLQQLLLPIAAGLVVGSIALAIFSRTPQQSDSELKLRSPLDWIGVFRLSVLLALILGAAALAKQWLGESATLVLSFLTGMVELQGISLANATMFTQGSLSIETARISVVLAVISSLSAKIFLSWIIGRGTFSRALTGVFTTMVLAVGSVAWLTLK